MLLTDILQNDKIHHYPALHARTLAENFVVVGGIDTETGLNKFQTADFVRVFAPATKIPGPGYFRQKDGTLKRELASHSGTSLGEYVEAGAICLFRCAWLSTSGTSIMAIGHSR